MPRPPPADTAAASSVVPTPPSTASWKGSRQPTRWVKRVSTVRTLGNKAARRVGNSDPGDVDGGVEATYPIICSTYGVDVQRPDWWCYPLRCSHGHPWAPGTITVSWMPCDCGPAQAQRSSGYGHLRVSCRTVGCGSVWYKPRHEPSG